MAAAEESGLSTAVSAAPEVSLPDGVGVNPGDEEQPIDASSKNIANRRANIGREKGRLRLPMNQ
jgi:hypothetical protein